MCIYIYIYIYICSKYYILKNMYILCIRIYISQNVD